MPAGELATPDPYPAPQPQRRQRRLPIITGSAHQVILDALRERDEPQGLPLIEDHLRGSYERVVGSMHEIEGDMSPEMGRSPAL